MVSIKPGSRVLGVAESFRKRTSKKSVLAGVVMRGDLIIDGFSFSFPTVGGLDATDEVLKLYNSLNREDINFICLNGCIISWFNIVDLNKVYSETNVPVISITYEESLGLEKYFREYFKEDWEERLRIYRRNGGRFKVKLKTGFEVFVRSVGIELYEAVEVLNAYTLHGKFPEPVRVARSLAHQLFKSLNSLQVI